MTLIWLAAIWAFFIVSLKVPVEARDLAYYINGLVVILAVSYLWRSREVR